MILILNSLLLALASSPRLGTRIVLARPTRPRASALASDSEVAIEKEVSLLDRLRDELRENLAVERNLSRSVRPSATITRTGVVVATVTLVAYATCPLLVDLLCPLSVVGSSSTATTAVTGVFMVPLGIVFGTMTSMTANVLRQRQLNVREVFYKEIAALDALSNVLAKLFQRDPRRLLASQAAVFRYCELCREQVEPGVSAMDEDLQRSFFAQRAALGTVHGQLASISDRETSQAAFNFSPGQAGGDAGRAWDLVNTILQFQASRSANFEHEFPFAHFVLMAVLGLCLPFSFLLVVLWGAPEIANTLGMRLLYALMCAIMAAVFNFLLDMNEPFAGIYAVQPRRLRVVQAGIINYMSRAAKQDALSLDDYIKGYKTLWTDASTDGGGSRSKRAQQVSVEARTALWLEELEREPERSAAELVRVLAAVETAVRELRECVATARAHWRGCGAHAAAPEWLAHRGTHRVQLTARWENLRRALKWQRAWRIGLDAGQSREARRMRLRELELGAAQLVFATLAAAGSDALVKARRLFQTVVVDEACQATEPATVVALQYGARKLLLVGDPQQMPATVLSRSAARAGYGRSLFERLQQAGARPFLLAEQYRMHPAIAHFPARHFYGGRLRSAADVDPHARAAPAALERLRAASPSPLGPYVFLDVARGREQRAGARGLSVHNAAEADACAALVGRLLAAAAACAGATRDAPLGGATVAIVSPYQAQLERVRLALGAHPRVRAAGVPLSELVELSTIDGFQGREKDVVLFTAVRAPPSGRIGFVADARRMNVGLTRARHAMWIVGHARTLADASDDWAALVADARARDVLRPWTADGERGGGDELFGGRGELWGLGTVTHIRWSQRGQPKPAGVARVFASS